MYLHSKLAVLYFYLEESSYPWLFLARRERSVEDQEESAGIDQSAFGVHFVFTAIRIDFPVTQKYISCIFGIFLCNLDL